MTIDNLLNIIIPLDLGLKGKNEALRCGVKLIVAVLVVVAIVGSAVSLTSDVCPEGMADWYVWVVVAWRIFLHTVIYCLVVYVLMAMEGKLKDMINGRNEPEVVEDQRSYDEDELEENSFFTSDIDQDALTSYIKSNPDKFTSGEDMAIFFLIMSSRSYIGANRKKFHKFLSSLIACKGYTQFSNGCLKVKEVLNYHSLDETRRKLTAKYEEMEKILKEFVIP